MRYRVFYSTDEQEYAICYGDNQQEAEEAFYRYNPDKQIRRVETATRLLDMSREGDLREFTDRLIEAICDQGEEKTYIDILYRQGYGRE